MNALSKATFRVITTSLIIVSAIIAGGYILYVATILLWTQPKALQPHDAIIVLTGSKGRIEEGFSLLLADKAPRLLISGVQRDNTLETLIQANSARINEDDVSRLRNHCCITLDYVADTTATNASEATKWVEANNIHRFILVTSAPHMPRAYLQFHTAIADGIGITPYPHWEERRINLVMNPSFWQYAAREYIKFAGSLIRLEQQ